MKAARKEMDRNTNRTYEADAGAVVVMEAKTGRVVAMASNPDYDPNAWVGGISAKDYKKLTGKDSNYPLLNRATQGQAAPAPSSRSSPRPERSRPATTSTATTTAPAPTTSAARSSRTSSRPTRA